MRHIRAMALVPSILSVLLLSLSLAAGAQERSRTKGRTTGMQNGALTATLVEPQKAAQQKAATVQVKVNGIKLTDPAAAHEKPKQGEGHLHYQLDNGPVIATTATKLSFHELPSGQHRITVMLAGNDHSPLGPQETLSVMIP